MRVLISAYACDPFGGSEGANAWYTAEGLARAGADVHILTRQADVARTDVAIRAYAANSGSGSMSSSVLTDAIPRTLDTGQVGVYARYAAWQVRCHEWAKDSDNGRWDVGHHLSWGSLSHPIGLAGCGLPLVIGPVGGGQSLEREHERWLDGDPSHDRWRTAALQMLTPRNPLARRAARQSALVLATNEETVSLARVLGARRIGLGLAEGLRTGQLRASAQAMPSELSTVWIGRFLPLKAAGLAVASFRHVLRQQPSARLTLIGDGPTKSRVEALAADLVRAGSVRFEGHLPWAEAQRVLAQARVHLFTSVRDSSSAQTLEAAALGVPAHHRSRARRVRTSPRAHRRAARRSPPREAPDQDERGRPALDRPKRRRTSAPSRINPDSLSSLPAT